MTKNWINFRFLHICPVEKCEISPNLAKIHISPHLLCGKTEIPLHVEKFHVLKSEISPHGRFLLHLHVGDRGDKYEVCIGCRLDSQLDDPKTVFVSTAKRCSSSQSVPGSHPIPSHPHIALVVLICSKLCLNAPD